MKLSEVKGVLLDTSFLIQLFQDLKPNPNAEAYWELLITHRLKLYISSVVVSEFCVKAPITLLPLENTIDLMFNFTHAERAGLFTKTLLEMRRSYQLNATRLCVLNDSKLMAQADTEPRISHFLTADTKSIQKYNALISAGLQLKFNVLDLHNPPSHYFF